MAPFLMYLVKTIGYTLFGFGIVFSITTLLEDRTFIGGCLSGGLIGFGACLIAFSELPGQN